MTTTSTPDWLYFASAGVLGVVGVVLLMWALFRDRPRGRKRCPKCWYDMTLHAESASLTCPECGRDAKRPRRLRRTRRRWRWALLAMLMLAGALGVGVTPNVREVGWTEYAPSTVLIWLIPSRGQRGDPVLRELIDRFELDEGRYYLYPPHDDYRLWAWQRHLLATRCAVALESDETISWTRSFCLQALQRLGPDAAPAVDAVTEVVVSGARKEQISALQTLHGIGPGASSALPVLMSELDKASPDAALRTMLVIRAVGRIGPEARPAVPALMQWLEMDAERHRYLDLQKSAIDALAGIGPGAVEAVPALRRIVEDGARGNDRPAALLALLQIGPPFDEYADTLVTAFLDPEVHLRTTAARLVQERDDLRPFAIQELVGRLSDADPAVRSNAARGLMSLGADAHPARADLVAALSDQDPVVRLFAERALTLIDVGEQP